MTTYQQIKAALAELLTQPEQSHVRFEMVNNTFIQFAGCATTGLYFSLPISQLDAMEKSTLEGLLGRQYDIHIVKHQLQRSEDDPTPTGTFEEFGAQLCTEESLTSGAHKGAALVEHLLMALPDIFSKLDTVVTSWNEFNVAAATNIGYHPSAEHILPIINDLAKKCGDLGYTSSQYAGVLLTLAAGVVQGIGGTQEQAREVLKRVFERNLPEKSPPSPPDGRLLN